MVREGNQKCSKLGILLETGSTSKAKSKSSARADAAWADGRGGNKNSCSKPADMICELQRALLGRGSTSKAQSMSSARAEAAWADCKGEEE